eukprot:scaffold101907_cov31-Tisochrysis_lutea.AAC.2
MARRSKQRHGSRNSSKDLVPGETDSMNRRGHQRRSGMNPRESSTETHLAREYVAESSKDDV